MFEGLRHVITPGDFGTMVFASQPGFDHRHFVLRQSTGLRRMDQKGKEWNVDKKNESDVYILLKSHLVRAYISGIAHGLTCFQHAD